MKIYRVIILMAMTLWALSAQAQHKSKLETEWGVQTGVGFWNYNVNGEKVDGRLGWQVGGSFALNWGAVALQPEIHFVHHSVPLAPSPIDPKDDLLLKSNPIEIPILFSLRVLKPFRIYAGPMITAFNNCKYEGVDDDHDIDFDRVRSTINYTAGVGVTLGGHFLIDARYNGTFHRQRLVGPMGNELRAQGHAVWVSFGYIFN